MDNLNTISVKTIKNEGDISKPDTAVIKTPFSKGQRLLVEYDTPRGPNQNTGYNLYSFGKHGKDIGLFEVTDFYLNLLVNPSVTMVELESKDIEFDKRYSSEKVMLVDEPLFLKRIRLIDEQMIIDGLNQKIIIPVLDDEGLKAKIGDNWFYFGGSEFEYTEPKDIPFETLVNEIKCVLDQFMEEYDFKDEYTYYYLYLKENLIDKEKLNTNKDKESLNNQISTAESKKASNTVNVSRNITSAKEDREDIL